MICVYYLFLSVQCILEFFAEFFSDLAVLDLTEFERILHFKILLFVSLYTLYFTFELYSRIQMNTLNPFVMNCIHGYSRIGAMNTLNTPEKENTSYEWKISKL